MTTVDLAVPSRPLAIGAHPDDIELQSGGTLAKWAASGCVVSFLVFTDGSKGTWDPNENRAALVVRREQEQLRAAAALGATGEVVLLGWTDGELDSGPRQRAQVASWIRKLRPDVVLGHDPWKRYRLHPDHRNAGFLVTDGIVAARDPMFFPELGFSPHRPTTLLLFEADEPDHYENIAGTLDAKVAALLEHESQFETTMGLAAHAAERSSEDIAAFGARIAEQAAHAGNPANLLAAESFKRIDDL